MASIMDQSTLHTLRGELSEEDFKNVIALYLDILPSRMAEIRAALHNRNLDALRETTHPLKSASRQLGALQLGNICEKLESMDPAMNTNQREGLVTEMEKAVEDVQKTLNQFMP